MLSFLTKQIGKDMYARSLLIPPALAATGADVIALQEVWSNHHKWLFKNAMKCRGYAYSYSVPRTLGMGDGLLIVSKYPIVSHAASPRFHVNTRSDEVFTHKRALYAEIEMPSGERVDFFTTHVGALTYLPEEGAYDPKEKSRQLKQYLQLKDWMLKIRKNRRSILAGDLNAHFLELESGRFQPRYASDYLKLIRNGCGTAEDLENSYLIANRYDAASEIANTYDQKNPYVATGYFKDNPSETEDYILTCGFAPEEVLSSEVVFREDLTDDTFASYPSIKKHPLRFSDHYGVLSTFSF